VIGGKHNASQKPFGSIVGGIAAWGGGTTQEEFEEVGKLVFSVSFY
jgi:hypothetical protein